jgi:acetyl esterase/lipase
MATLPRPVVERIARYTVKPWLRAPLPVRRTAIEALARVSRVPAGVAISRQARGGVAGELATPDGVAPSSPRILYLHGGAYEWGSPRTHRNVVATLALRSGLPVFAADYRLAPEHPAPAALDDALAVYEAMAADAGGGVALAGDSAGGGLALALAVAVRDQRLPAPPGLGLVSPWVDLTMSGRSITENKRRDALLPRQAADSGVRSYAAVLGAAHPVCSPIRSDLSGLPPMLIHVGAYELFLSEGEDLARRAEAAGVEVELKVHDGLWHAFHNHAGMLREADDALAEISTFLVRRL